MRVLRAASVVVAAAFGASLFAQSTGNAEWVSWSRAHAFPIVSVVAKGGDDYADLQFLKQVIGDRRLVQLGESGHGIAEFDSAKVRLIRFFHEQMGFDVIAFESAIYECYAANARTGSGTQLLNASIFTVWATYETVPLFDYLRDSRSSDRPLILAGFDSQVSSSIGIATRPAFFRKIVGVIDPEYAEKVFLFDSDFVGRVGSGGPAYARVEEARLTAGYEQLLSFLHDHRSELIAAMPGDQAPLVAEQTARSMITYVRQLSAALDNPNSPADNGPIAIRDRAMADNVAFLANEMYPGKKILIWAHNFHIRHANADTTSAVRTMGSYVAEKFRPDLYTIGLYMNRGQGALNNRTVYTISPAPTDSLEWILAYAGPSTLFIDMLGAKPEPGNEWMFTTVGAREWGLTGVPMIPRDQYDGILFIDTVKVPSYLPFF